MSLRPFFVVALICAAGPLAAQEIDYDKRAGDLTALSRIFGELHDIRRHCEPQYEADVWRERMKTLIELEMPQGGLRQDMVAAFNAGYRSAEARFAYCDRDARDYAAAIAVRGDAIATRLVEPLYEALAQSYDLQRTPVVGEDRDGDEDDD